MKKLIIFLSFAFTLLLVGCQKEVVRPNDCLSDKEQTTAEYGEKANSGEEDDRDGRDDSVGDGKPKPITDPNHDEDEDEKIRK